MLTTVRPLKTIVHPVSGQTFKLGRRRPIARCPSMFMGNYLTRASMQLASPTQIDYTRTPASFLSQVLGNDTLGDCTAAGAFHIGGTLLANAGAQIPFTRAQAIAFYSATTGYIPGDPATDQGGDEQTVLNYWQQTGLLPNQHKIAGWMRVNGADRQEVQAAIWIAENVYFGVELPAAWVSPMPSANGFVWDVAGDPDPDNGHCFVGLGYTAQGVIIDTWGMIGVITWAGIAKYATTPLQGELYAVLGRDALDRAQKLPCGFDWSQATADLDSLGADIRLAA